MTPILMPFTVRHHPAADQVQAQASAWADQFGLVHRNDQQQFGRFMASVYPDAAQERLQWICDFTLWLFAVDDDGDEGTTGRDPEQVEQLHRTLFTILHGAPAGPTPLGRAAADLATRLVPLAPDLDWRARFFSQCAAYSRGNIWEAANRRAQRTPGLVEYVQERLYTSSMFMYELFIELAGGFALNARPALLRQLELAANTVVSYGNDLASLEKEAASGDVHNLVLVLAQEYRLDRPGAIATAIDLHNREVWRYITWREQLQAHGQWVGHIPQYAQGLEDWMAANAAWGQWTRRYNK